MPKAYNFPDYKFISFSVAKFNTVFETKIQKGLSNQKHWDAIHSTLEKYCNEQDKSAYILVQDSMRGIQQLVGINPENDLIHIKGCTGVFKYDTLTKTLHCYTHGKFET